MVEIGGRPILWHIMKIYSAQGINEFVICCGYKGYLIKEYFANYLLHVSDVTIDVQQKGIEVHSHNAEPWRVTLVDTGDGSGTGGRLLRVRDYIGDGTFMMTYGDGVSNVDLKALAAFHRSQGTLATLTAVQPPGRFGAFRMSEDATRIVRFREKPKGDGAWVNGGFFVLEPAVVNYLSGDETVWEREPLERLAADGELSAFRHTGFWQPMDTLRDKMYLEKLWTDDKAPWKAW
jgi:glucose-1-phosphate cytidylyltransferase